MSNCKAVRQANIFLLDILPYEQVFMLLCKLSGVFHRRLKSPYNDDHCAPVLIAGCYRVQSINHFEKKRINCEVVYFLNV